MNRAETINLIKSLLGTYPNTKMSNVQATVDAWEMEFGEYPAETIYKAARCHMGRSKFFPSPAEIKKFIPIAPLLFNESTLNAIESGTIDVVDDGAVSGCDLCPYNQNGWADTPNGCHRERCAV